MGGNCWIDWKTSCDSAVKKGNEYSKLAKHMLRVGHLVLVELSTGAMIGVQPRPEGEASRNSTFF